MTDGAQTYCAICAGAGVGCEGFRRAGWKLLAAVERDAQRRTHLARQFGDVKLFDDLTALKGDNLPRCDAWLCTLPCQSYSVAATNGGGLADPRGLLWWHVLRCLDEARWHGTAPKVILCENVPGQLESNGGRDAEEIRSSAEASGLTLIRAELVDAREHGCPQRRLRLLATWRVRDDW